MSKLLRFSLLTVLGVSVNLLSGTALHASGQQKPEVPFLDPNIIRICVNQLLYEHTFNDGTPAGERTIIDPNAASLACRGVKFEEDVLAVRQCVNGLLYTMTFSNGNPAGERTILDPTSAARACTFCKGRH